MAIARGRGYQAYQSCVSESFCLSNDCQRFIHFPRWIVMIWASKPSTQRTYTLTVHPRSSWERQSSSTISHARRLSSWPRFVDTAQMKLVDELIGVTTLCFQSSEQLAGVVGRTPGEIYYPGSNMEENGYVNQYGLNRKACSFFLRPLTLYHEEAYLRSSRLAFFFIEYLWGSQSELETSSVGLHRFTSM